MLQGKKHSVNVKQTLYEDFFPQTGKALKRKQVQTEELFLDSDQDDRESPYCDNPEEIPSFSAGTDSFTSNSNSKKYLIKYKKY